MSLESLKNVAMAYAKARRDFRRYHRKCRKSGNGYADYLIKPESPASAVQRAVTEALDPKSFRGKKLFLGQAQVVLRKWSLEPSPNGGATGEMLVEFGKEVGYHVIRSVVPIFFRGVLVGDSTWCGPCKYGLIDSRCLIHFKSGNFKKSRALLGEACVP